MIGDIGFEHFAEAAQFLGLSHSQVECQDRLPKCCCYKRATQDAEEKRKEKIKSTPLGVMTGASVPSSSPRCRTIDFRQQTQTCTLDCNITHTAETYAPTYSRIL